MTTRWAQTWPFSRPSAEVPQNFLRIFVGLPREVWRMSIGFLQDFRRMSIEFVRMPVGRSNISQKIIIGHSLLHAVLVGSFIIPSISIAKPREEGISILPTTRTAVYRECRLRSGSVVVFRCNELLTVQPQ